MAFPANDGCLRLARAALRVLVCVCIALLLPGCKVGGWYFGADLLPRNSLQFLDYSIRRHNLNAVKQLIESGEVGVNDVIDEEWYGKRPLHLAVYRRDKDIISYLVQRGANVNMRTATDIGATPLHAAIGYGYEDIALLLLDLGANPAMQYDEGMTTCHAARKVHDYARRANRPKYDMSRLIARLPGCKDEVFDDVCP